MIAERECVIEALRRLKGVESIRCVVFHAQFSRGTHTRDAGPDGGGVCEGKTGQNAGASGFADGPASEVGKRDAGVQETRDLKGMVRDMDGRAGIYDLEASGLASALFQMGVASVGVGVQLDGQGGADRQTDRRVQGGAAGGWSRAVTWVREFGVGGMGYEETGGKKQEAVRVWIRTKRRGERFSSGVGQAVKNLLAGECARELGWLPTANRTQASLELHLVLYDGGCLVDVPLLVPSRSSIHGGIPQPGLKSAECWALAKSLDIKSGHVIIDPMCGSGSVLLEAALFWPQAQYIGLDKEQRQVDRAMANARTVQSSVHDFRVADVSLPGSIPVDDGGCDGIICDLPFGKQHGSRQDNTDLYPRALREFARVVTRRMHGVMVLLTG